MRQTVTQTGSAPDDWNKPSLKDSSGLLAKPAPLMVRRDPPVALVRVL